MLQDHPERAGWKVGNEVDLREPLPEAPDGTTRYLYGNAPDDWQHRLYLIPAETSIEDIVEFFEAGTHRAIMHGWDERDTIDLVVHTLTEVDAIVPGSIELASSDEVRFRFWRRLRLDELEQIEGVYRKVDDYQAGLEDYVNGGTGDSLLAEIRETGVLRLRWP